MMLNLNLGSGSKRIEGFVNLDKFDTFNPDIVHDLEFFLIHLRITVLIKLYYHM